MPTFDIVKKSTPKDTYRVNRIYADFDVKPEHSQEHFIGEIKLPENWQIGVIVGGSGTGKSTIAKELFKESYISGFDYSARSVIDDISKNKTVEEIEKMFYAVGFGSVPSWLKPYEVLSNGEKMRVDLARALLEKDQVCFDEFTSVVDRQVAQTACLAVSKAIRKQKNTKFIAVSCHYDILDFLEPDWIFDTNTMQMDFRSGRTRQKSFSSEGATEANGENFGSITI